MGGLLTVLPLARGGEDAGARNNRRRRNRKETWKLSAHPLTHFDEHPASSGDASAYNSKAQITITRRRNRSQICATFQYYTDASSTNQINVRDVIIQPGNTSHSTPAVFTFAGWAAANVHDAGCQRIDTGLAQDIVSDPGTYHLDIRQSSPSSEWSGGRSAVAALGIADGLSRESRHQVWSNPSARTSLHPSNIRVTHPHCRLCLAHPALLSRLDGRGAGGEGQKP